MSAKTPAYLLAQIDVKNYDDYVQQYGFPALPLFQKHNAEILVASPTKVVKEGEWVGNWTVVLRFASMEDAEAFYNDEDYAPLKKLRIGQLTNSNAVVLLEGWTMPTQ
jgi:uncharacterized protein (DUF1330 family)